MSLIARCPVCQTWYKVAPDQLRISDGWVRCGTCGEIFDVSRHLIEAESELPAGPGPVDAREFPPQPLAADVVLRDASTRLPIPSMAKNQPPSDDAALVMPSVVKGFSPGVQPDAPWDSAALLIKPSLETEDEAGPEIANLPRAPVTKPVTTVAAPVTEPVSFMRAPVIRPDMQLKGKGFLWGALCVPLLFGLLAQGLYRERDQLAALRPEITPALQTFCEVLGCRISPLKRIEAFVLDAATFHQVDPDTFQLHLVVKNNTQLALALPAVELTLTDLTDQPVTRRVFLPAELGAQSETMSALGEWSATANLRVMADTTGPRALGFRLLVFYP